MSTEFEGKSPTEIVFDANIWDEEKDGYFNHRHLLILNAASYLLDCHRKDNGTLYNYVSSSEFYVFFNLINPVVVFRNNLASSVNEIFYSVQFNQNDDILDVAVEFVAKEK